MAEVSGDIPGRDPPIQFLAGAPRTSIRCGSPPQVGRDRSGPCPESNQTLGDCHPNWIIGDGGSDRQVDDVFDWFALWLWREDKLGRVADHPVSRTLVILV